MYFDNLTWVFLVIFLVALGSFIYGCIIRNCLTSDHQTRTRSSQSTHPTAR